MKLRSVYNYLYSIHLNRLYSKKCNASINKNILKKEDFKNDSIYFGSHSNVYKNKISGKVRIGEYCWVSDAVIEGLNGTEVNIGSYSSVQGGGSQIISKLDNSIKIGRFCTIGYGAMVICHSHKIDTYTQSWLNKRIFVGSTANVSSFGNITVGHDCTIGMYSFIMPGVTLGNGCIVSPNSVVTSSFEPYSIIAGNPAVKIGTRFSQKKIDYLKELNWYEWEHDAIVANIESLMKRVHTKTEFV